MTIIGGQVFFVLYHDKITVTITVKVSFTDDTVGRGLYRCADRGGNVNTLMKRLPFLRDGMNTIAEIAASFSFNGQEKGPLFIRWFSFLHIVGLFDIFFFSWYIFLNKGAECPSLVIVVSFHQEPPCCHAVYRIILFGLSQKLHFFPEVQITHNFTGRGLPGSQAYRIGIHIGIDRFRDLFFRMDVIRIRDIGNFVEIHGIVNLSMAVLSQASVNIIHERLHFFQQILFSFHILCILFIHHILLFLPLSFKNGFGMKHKRHGQ